ncbi:hypothetical protein [Streptomyces sp. SD15]
MLPLQPPDQDPGNHIRADGDLAEGRHAEIDSGGSAGCLGIELGQLVLRAGEADLESFDLTEPSFTFGFGDADEEVVADFDQPCPLGRIWSEE